MPGFNINHVVLSGNLTRDPELRSTSGGTSVCSLRIANNTRRKNSSGEWEDKPNYFNVTIWKGMGEWVASNLSKGDRVVVDGRIEWREWQPQEGGKRQEYDIIADSIVPAPRREEGGGGFTPQSDVPADTSDLPGSEPPGGTAPPGQDDDIPF